MREAVVATVQGEHMNAEGAAAFAVLHPLGARRLIPLLVAYQLTWDVVDTLLEQAQLDQAESMAICRTLKSALALEPPEARVGDGFLGELVDACRACCAALPRYAEAEPVLRRLSGYTDALLVTNGAASGRPDAIARWCRRRAAATAEVEPLELCAAAHCSLAIHAVLATAANPGSRPRDFEAVEAAYFPWVDALCTLLDSLVDREADAQTGEFSFIGEYPSPAYASGRLAAIAERAVAATRALPAGARHAALLSALVAMYGALAAARAPGALPAVAAVAAPSAGARRVLALRAAAERLLGEGGAGGDARRDPAGHRGHHGGEQDEHGDRAR